MSSEINEDDMINILIATDLHLGCHESDAIRGEDSFITFEEILELAGEHDVDFILLGGDLFHYAKPSPSCLLKTTSLLRKYCFGNRPSAIEILSDQCKNFKESISKTVNYEDPNLNISYPIFSIHGNHDDPIGKGAVSSLDILSRLGLINYFGKWTDYNEITVSPILMQKGETKLALYGLSYLKDQRLARLFRDERVKMEKVPNEKEWVNILTLHQNRADRGPLNFIKEEWLPDFLNLVIWGHEHDCRIEPEYNATKDFHVTQPGSPVATSLAQGESLPKHCGLLKIHKEKFKLIPLPLQTVRPFVFETIVLSEQGLGLIVNASQQAQDFLKDRVEEALAEADKQRSGHPKQPDKPLIRLNVLYEEDTQQFNVIRFGQEFSGRIANPPDLIVMKREKVREKKTVQINLNRDALDKMVAGEAGEDMISVEAVVEKYFDDQPEANQLQMLSVKSLGDCIQSCTVKEDNEVFANVTDWQIEKYMAHLKKSNVETEFEVLEQISVFKNELYSNGNDVVGEIKKVIDAIPKKASNDDEVILSDSDDEPIMSKRTPQKPSPEPSSPTGRGRGRGRGSRGGARGGRGSRGARGGSKSTLNPLNISYETASNSTNTSSKNWLANFSQKSSSKQPEAKPLTKVPKPAPKAKASVKPMFYDSDDD